MKISFKRAQNDACIGSAEREKFGTQFKKRFLLLSMAALALVGVMMTGCSNEDEAIVDNQEKHLVTLTTTISLDGGDGTRALDAAGHKTFVENDQIAVIYKNTSNETKSASVVLAASDISADGKTATISVTFENPAENSQLRMIYPAAMLKTPIETSTTIDNAGTINYDNLNAQDGYLGSLGQYYDLAVYDGAMVGNALPTAITLSNKLAVCAFTLKDDKGTPETSDDEDITSHITNLTVSDGTNAYTISRSVGVGPLYVAMKPVTAALTFTATDEYGQHYTKTLSSKSFAANNIYPIGMKMVKSYKTYSTLPVGTLLKLGDQIALSTNKHINSEQWIESGKAPFTLVRANVEGSTVTEAADGTHYVLKDKDGGFHLQENNFLVSEATDGLIVANYNEPNNSYVCCTHVNLAAIDISKLPVDNSWKAKYYTAHTYECLYGTLDGDVLLRIQSDAAVWLGGMMHHSGKEVCGIECPGSALINLVDGTTNDLTPGDQNAYCGISGVNGIITIDGTGTLLASGGVGFAGIGGLDYMVSIVINGGNLTVAGGANAAGIGANNGYTIGDITINGGNLTVTGGTNAAGIGCGYPSNSIISSGNITINGGNVTVTGGTNAAGIGCGAATGNGPCGDITFSGGTVVVNPGTGGCGVGLNKPNRQTCGNINFNGGSVTVYGTIRTSPGSIYINDELQGSRWIDATSDNPFVYPVPQQ